VSSIDTKGKGAARARCFHFYCIFVEEPRSGEEVEPVWIAAVRIQRRLEKMVTGRTSASLTSLLRN
jgi:predicted RNA-binding protein with TRAM domain